MAQKVAKIRVAVANSLWLLRLPDTAERTLTDGEITEGHGRAMLGAKASLSRGTKGSGRLVIQFYSEEELERIHNLIVGE